MKHLILLVGLPGSGKSTIASAIEKDGYTRICADIIRGELYGDEGTQGKIWEVIERMYEKYDLALAKGLPIIIDNTNVRRRDRIALIDRAADYGYTKIDIFQITTPLDECLKRNAARSRVVPEDVIRRMAETLMKEPPNEAPVTLISNWETKVDAT